MLIDLLVYIYVCVYPCVSVLVVLVMVWWRWLDDVGDGGIRKGAVFGPLGGGLRRGSAAFGQRKPQQQQREKRERVRYGWERDDGG